MPVVSGPVNLFGRTCTGLRMHSYYQPRLISYAGLIHKTGRDIEKLNEVIPLPEDWAFVANTSQLQVMLSEMESPRFQTVYGFIGPSISATDSQGTQTPAQCQVIVQLDFKYGSSELEVESSFIFVRINAYTSQACLNGDFTRLLPGTPVKGVVCRSSEKGYQSAQLVGWGPCDVAEWKGLAPDSFPRRGLELSSAAIFNLPQLHSEHFPPVLSWPAMNYILIQQPTIPFEESRRFFPRPTLYLTSRTLPVQLFVKLRPLHLRGTPPVNR